MVQVRYRGKNTIIFPPKYKFKSGVTDVLDSDFYELMKSPLFANRVKNGVFEVPADFPLEKPLAKKEAAPVEEAAPAKEEISDRLNVKQTLKLISASEDKDYLQSVIDSDGREKVVEEAKARLDSLNL